MLLFPTSHERLCLATGATLDASRKVEEWGLIESENPNDDARGGRGKRKQFPGEALCTLSRVVAVWRAGFSLVQSAAIITVANDFHWAPKIPSPISHRGSGARSDLSHFLDVKASEVGAENGDLFLRVLNGEFLYERRGPEGEPRHIARLSEGGVIAPEERRRRVVETIGGEPKEKKLPIEFGDVRRALAKQAELEPVSEVFVNVSLCWRVALRKLYELEKVSAR